MQSWGLSSRTVTAFAPAYTKASFGRPRPLLHAAYRVELL